MTKLKEYIQRRKIRKMDKLFSQMASTETLIEYLRIRESYGNW